MERIVFLIIGILILVGIINQITTKILPRDYCTQDSDCVAATCCHPSACVNKNYAPNCTGIVCSLECKPGTMDCGQGYCACVDNKCKAIIRE